MISVPALMVVVPVKVLVLARVTEPVPFLVRFVEPVMAPVPESV